MRKIIAFVIYLLSPCVLGAQEWVEDKWVDDDLLFRVTWEAVRELGQFDVCIAKEETNCIANLRTTFETRVYDSTETEIWNGIWSGIDEQVNFSKPLPDAKYIVIRATRPLVVNTMTGGYIHQSRNLELTYTLE
jgi:hypothetical protein